MHAALDDDFGIDADGIAGKLQRIALDVGDAVEDLRRLVIVRQDENTALTTTLISAAH